MSTYTHADVFIRHADEDIRLIMRFDSRYRSYRYISITLQLDMSPAYALSATRMHARWLRLPPPLRRRPA